MPIPPDDISIAHSGDITSSTVSGGPNPASQHVPNGDGGFDPIGSGGNSAETESVVSDTLIADGDDAEWDKVGQDTDLDLDGLLAESEALDLEGARGATVAMAAREILKRAVRSRLDELDRGTLIASLAKTTGLTRTDTQEHS